MEMNVRERLNDHRPYWKVVVSLAFSLLGTVLFVYIGIKALLYFMPFVIGWFLSFIVSPLVVWLEKRLKIVKRLGSALIIVLALAICVGVIYLIFSRLLERDYSFNRGFPIHVSGSGSGIQSNRGEDIAVF